MLSSCYMQGAGISPLPLVSPSSQQLCKAARGPHSVTRRWAWAAGAAPPTARQFHTRLRAPATPDRSLWPRAPSLPITGGTGELVTDALPTSARRTRRSTLTKYHGGPSVLVLLTDPAVCGGTATACAPGGEEKRLWGTAQRRPLKSTQTLAALPVSRLLQMLPVLARGLTAAPEQLGASS